MLYKITRLLDYMYISFYALIFIFSCFTLFSYANGTVPLNDFEWVLFVLTSTLIICSALGIMLILTSMTKRTRMDSYYFACFAFLIILLLTTIEGIFTISHFGFENLLLYTDFHIVICFAVAFRIAFIKLFIEGGV